MGRPATQHEVRKAEIVSAALKCFVEHGYEGTTNKLIAKTAGLNSAALIYHYFPSKESLFKACIDDVEIVDELHDYLANPGDLPPEEFMTRAALNYLSALQSPKIGALLPILFESIQSHPELVPLLMERIQSALWVPLRAYFQKLVDQGILQPASTATIMQVFFGPLVVRMMSKNFFSRSIVFDTRSDEEFVRYLIHTFWDGARVK
jgi:AcrR family transcriptional regulator